MTCCDNVTGIHANRDAVARKAATSSLDTCMRAGQRARERHPERGVASAPHTVMDACRIVHACAASMHMVTACTPISVFIVGAGPRRARYTLCTVGGAVQSANALTGCGVLCEQRRAWRRSRRGMLLLVASGHCIRHPARHRRRVSSGLVYSNSVVHATTHFAIASYRDTVGWYRYSKRWTEKR